jgi:hypothetical protein
MTLFLDSAAFRRTILQLVRGMETTTGLLTRHASASGSLQGWGEADSSEPRKPPDIPTRRRTGRSIVRSWWSLRVLWLPLGEKARGRGCAPWNRAWRTAQNRNSSPALSFRRRKARAGPACSCAGDRLGQILPAEEGCAKVNGRRRRNDREGRGRTAAPAEQDMRSRKRPPSGPTPQSER